MTQTMTPSNGIWVLFASDVEMSVTEKILISVGEKVAHAGTVGADGTFNRVRPGQTGTYGLKYVTNCGPAGDKTETWYLVEGRMPTPDGCPVVVIDHHSEGDDGYGLPPEDFMNAASIGQVIRRLAELGKLPSDWVRIDLPVESGIIMQIGTSCGGEESRWRTMRHVISSRGETVIIPDEVVLTAAADHCLGAAYGGQCPGVSWLALTAFRVKERAAFQKRSEAEVLADIEATTKAFDVAPILALDSSGAPATVLDMRRETPWPELVEAATRRGTRYISGPLVGPDGRKKFTCSGSALHVKKFLEEWGPNNGLVDMYGDTARGFAGGYLR